VFVQTYNPDHVAIRAAERHDYEQFAAAELPIRQQFGYPPYGSLVRLIVRGTDASRAAALADQLARRLEPLERTCEGFRRLGPAPAPIEKLRGKYRYHLIVRVADLAPLRPVLLQAQAELKASDELQWQVDVDPLDML
jgi:primosomal protein N' (replication factor Y)